MPRPALLVDSGFSAAPIFRAAERHRWSMAVIGNNPDAYLHRLTDQSHHEDYSLPAALAAIVEEHGYKALIPGCTDASYLSCAHIAADFGFPGIDTLENTRRILTKSGFRQLCEQLMVPAPTSFTVEAALQQSSGVIVKPVDAHSGQGITSLKKGDKTALRRALDKARAQSAGGEAVIESLVEGQLFSTSLFVRNRKPVRSFLVEEHCLRDSYAVSVSRVVEETPGENRSAVEQDLLKIANHLKLVDGLLHLQWIEGNNDRYWHIELTRRCPGDLYARLIELSTGFDYAAAYAAPFLGRHIEEDCTSTRDDPVNVRRFTVLGKPGSVLEHLRFASAQAPLEFHPLIPVGGLIGATGRAGILFCPIDEEADNPETAEEAHALSYYIQTREPGERA